MKPMWQISALSLRKLSNFSRPIVKRPELPATLTTQTAERLLSSLMVTGVTSGLLFVPVHQQFPISQPGKDDGDDLFDARGLNVAG